MWILSKPFTSTQTSIEWPNHGRFFRWNLSRWSSLLQQPFRIARTSSQWIAANLQFILSLWIPHWFPFGFGCRHNRKCIRLNSANSSNKSLCKRWGSNCRMFSTQRTEAPDRSDIEMARSQKAIQFPSNFDSKWDGNYWSGPEWELTRIKID